MQNISVIFFRSPLESYFHIFTGFSEKQGNMAASAPFNISSEWDIRTVAEDSFHYCCLCCRSIFDAAG